MIPFKYNDGGRAAAGFKGETGDCVVRAIAIATGLPYRQVLNDIRRLNKNYVATSRTRIARTMKDSGTQAVNPANGTYKPIYHRYLLMLGWTWTPIMKIGSGCTTHLRSNELPDGRLIVRVSRHLTAVLDGVLNDTGDCSRRGKRCVYGYYSRNY